MGFPDLLLAWVILIWTSFSLFAAPRGNRRVLYNLDGDSCMTLRAGRNGPGPITLQDLTNLVSELTGPGSQVDTFLVCVNAQVLYYPTRMGTLRGTLSTAEERARWSPHERQRFENLERFYGAGIDPYAVLLAEARRRELETLLTFRMNDAHGNDFLRTAFWQDHPEFRLPNGALDFSHGAVRDYVYGLIEETVRRYDTDGLELDFQRFPTFFKGGTAGENIAAMNAFVERVRRLLDNEGSRRGRRLLLAARAPTDYGQSRPVPAQAVAASKACDIAEWNRRGWVDFLTVSDWLFNSETLGLADWKTWVPGIPIYGAIQPESRPSANDRHCEHCLGVDGYLRSARERWSDGANGIYLFNFFTSREWPEPTEPPFEVLSQLGDRDRLLATATDSSTRSTNRPASRIPILAWHSIPESELSLARFEELAGMGITHSLMHYSPEGTARALDLAARVGVQQFVGDARLSQPGEPLTQAVNAWKDHPALAGYSLRDEPSAPDFAALAAARDALFRLDPRHPSYVNLFPTYASSAQLGTSSYPEYLRAFMVEFRPQLLSFDHYPVLEGDRLREDYYQNLEWIRQASEEFKVPFWAFALACAHKPYPMPSLPHIRLQAWSNFAYGARGLQYFTYWTPRPGTWDFHDAPIREDGTRSPTYDLLRSFNRELQGSSDWILNSRVTGVFHTGARPQGTRGPDDSCPFREVNGGDALIGVFQSTTGRRHTLVVNRSLTQSATLTLHLQPWVRSITAGPPLSGSRVSGVSGKDFAVSLEPGSAAWLQIE